MSIISRQKTLKDFIKKIVSLNTEKVFSKKIKIILLSNDILIFQNFMKNIQVMLIISNFAKKFNQNEIVVEVFSKIQVKNFQLESLLKKYDSSDITIKTHFFQKNMQIF
jgi:hypothetical protein